MSNQKEIIHNLITVLTIGVAILALPFSVRVCHISLILLCINWTAEGNWKAKWNRAIHNPLATLFIALFTFHLVGMVYTTDQTSGWFNLEKKVFILLLPVVIATIPPLSSRHIKLLFNLFIISCLTASLLCLSYATYRVLHYDAIPYQLNFNTFTTEQYTSLNPDAPYAWLFFSYAELASGVNMHPTYLALYQIVCFLLVCELYGRSFKEFTIIKKITFCIVLLYICTFIILLSSRIVILSLLVTCISLVLLVFWKENKRMALGLSLTVSIFIYMLIYLNPVSRFRNLQEPVTTSLSIAENNTYENSVSIRNSLWWLGVQTARNVNTVWGAGTGDVNQEMKKMGEYYSIDNSINSSSTHNQFLHTMVALGLIGVVLLIGCFAWPAYEAFRQKDYFYLAFIFCFVTACITENVLEMQKGIVLFSLFNSLLLFHNKLKQSKQLVHV